MGVRRDATIVANNEQCFFYCIKTGLINTANDVDQYFLRKVQENKIET